MPSLSPAPGLEHYFKICRKGDPEANAITEDESPVAGIADASEITGLRRNNFEMRQISNEEFEQCSTSARTRKSPARKRFLWPS
jgi:hypothetical protein